MEILNKFFMIILRFSLVYEEAGGMKNFAHPEGTLANYCQVESIPFISAQLPIICMNNKNNVK